jgi:hypothetical protein
MHATHSHEARKSIKNTGLIYYPSLEQEKFIAQGYNANI